MAATYPYIRLEPNYDSAYNILPSAPPPTTTTYLPFYSSTTFIPSSTGVTPPFFRRTISPPPRPPVSTGTAPKFNFDLYKMDNKYDEYLDSISPTYRPTSPPPTTTTATRIVYHHRIHSPVSSPTSETGTFSRLRQINDELSRSLARSELIDRPISIPAPQHHIHHYPLSQHTYRKHRSRSRSGERPPVTEIDLPTRINKARVTYKIHIPRRHYHHHHRESSPRLPTSDGYSSDEPVVVNLYPTRDEDSVKQSKSHSDNQSPWLVDGKSYPYDSYPNTRISQGPHYGDKPIETYQRSKERPSSSKRHESPYLNPRIRSDSQPFVRSTHHQQSNDSFSSTGQTPRKSDRIWRPSSRKISEKPPKYFHPASKPDHDETQSEPRSERRTYSDRTKIKRTSDPKPEKLTTEPKSKIKSTWQPTVIGISQPSGKESQRTVPTPVKKTTADTPPKTKEKSVPSEATTPTEPVVTGPPATVNHDRSSSNGIPIKPVAQSTPKDQQDTHKNNESLDDLFDGDDDTPEPPKISEPPRKPSADSPNIVVPEPDKGTKPTIKDGVLVHGNDDDDPKNRTPTPPANGNHNDQKPANDRVIPSGKPKDENKESEDEGDRDENDDEVARSFDINKWLSDASKAILGPPKPGPLDLPSTKPKTPPPKPKPTDPPRRREQPRSPTPDENLYKPPFGPKRTAPKPSSSPPPPAPTTTTDDNDEAADFFS